MKQELSTMMDMVREMYEDGRKSSILREKLNSMEEERQMQRKAWKERMRDTV